MGPVSAQVSREAGPLTLAVGRVEGRCRPRWQLSKHKSWGWEAAQLGNWGARGGVAKPGALNTGSGLQRRERA